MMSVAYAEAAPTPPMIVIKTCSLTVKGPGLSGKPKIVHRGRMYAHNRPRGNEISCGTSCVKHVGQHDIE